jgi:hypothetical protein
LARIGGAASLTPQPDHHEGKRSMAKRTTLYSSKGKKLYAVRDKDGKFKDIQTYQRAHAADMRSKSKAELATAKKKKKKKTAKKAVKKKKKL